MTSLTEIGASAALERKAAAFERLQELRKKLSACRPGSLDEERAAAMSEKYGGKRREPIICRHSVLCTGKR